MMADFLQDVDQLAIAASSPERKVTRMEALTRLDSSTILAIHRFPHTRSGQRMPMARWLVRRLLASIYGMEIGPDVQLGHGVYFVHTLGVVLGGDAKVGARVRFYGNNTVGTARDDGYPVIEDDVQVGCGARILGRIRVGARCVIGANAVVLADVPPDSVVVGVPARVVNTRPQQVRTARVPT